MITVVSGLPRSGTSLMMQMLAAGGLMPLADEVRAPDADNPRGYYEYEPVKRTRQDTSWVPLAVGRAVKVVYALLPDLPDGFDYRVIMMSRPVAEVVQSQRVMLARTGVSGTPLGDDALGELFLRQLRHAEARLAARAGFRCLTIDYHACVYRTPTVVEQLAAFLAPAPLDRAAMLGVVDVALHRHRS